MQNFIAILKLLEFVAPLIVRFITLAETMLPPGTPGVAKLDLVKFWITQAIETEAEMKAVFDSAWPLLNGAINRTVALYNNASKPAIKAPVPATVG